MDESFALETVETSMSPLERLEEYLQSRGKRITQERRLIVDEVFRRHDHFDADELLANLNRNPKGNRVSRPTVYRALAVLVDAGLLRKMALKGRTVYEHDYGYPQHDHLHCQECDKLIEFHSDELKRIRNAVAREHRFRVTGHRLTITGICADCSSKKHRTRRLELV
jgi:Fur family ferric uptake transcriptional regulator